MLTESLLASSDCPCSFQEYIEDGIDWAKVDFEDNQDCLSLFEKVQNLMQVYFIKIVWVSLLSEIVEKLWVDHDFVLLFYMATCSQRQKLVPYMFTYLINIYL